MTTDKIERFREVMTMRVSPTQFDALVLAVREDEREKAVARVLLEKVEADVTKHPSDYAYNQAIDDAVGAIRNA